jgi:pimeloyl-ACP methyl ester carboxylesterase
MATDIELRGSQVELESTTVETSRGHIHVTTGGAGEPLVMLHGGGPGASALANYRDNLPALAAEFRLVLPDQPGFGGSYRPGANELADPGITALARDSLLEALNVLGVDSFHLLGNSLGGATALSIAIAAPERVRSLVLMAPGGGWLPTGPTPTEGQKAMFRYYNGEGPTLRKMKDFVGVMVANPRAFDETSIQERFDASLDKSHIEFYHRYNAAFGARGGMDPLWQEVEHIHCPTLLLWGRDDRTITLDGAGVMLQRIPDVQLHVFGNCGHWVQVERKAAFERLVIDFLGS